MRHKPMVVLAAGLALAACTAEGIGRDEPVAEDREVENRTPYEQLDNTAQSEAEDYGGPGAAPVTPVQGGATVGGPLTATGQFEGVGQNPPPGSVTLTQVEQGTRLSILINGYTANARLQADIVRGTCQTQGAVVQTVPGTIQTGEDGVADINAVVPVSTAQLLDGQHAVRLTSNAGVVGCAMLPQRR